MQFLSSETGDNNNLLPGLDDYVYGDFQSYEEAEAHSYSIRRQAKEIFKLLKTGQDKNINSLQDDLLTLAYYLVVIADRNIRVTNALVTAFNSNEAFELDFGHTKWDEQGLIITIPLHQDGKSFEYRMNVYNVDIKKSEDVVSYVESKIIEMNRLNPNYMAQFSMVLQATEILKSSAKTKLEKLAVLEGIISITRPHFWDNDNFVTIDRSDLVNRFNSVVSDRLMRFSKK